jgi:hypothetical protein
MNGFSTFAASYVRSFRVRAAAAPERQGFLA